jgi:ceramide glucosyltransferase
MHTLWYLWTGSALAIAAMGYSLVAWFAVQSRGRDAVGVGCRQPAVSVLKPLCGAEPGLYESLRTCCEQTYPIFQIVCGVRDEQDPAVAVVRRLQAELPNVDLQLVIDRRQYGSNRKVSNLINMLPHARHDFLIVADGDVHVPPGYLAAVTAPLLSPDVGIVTCPYRGRPRAGLWSLLGSLFINDWFIPSVRVAALSGSRSFAFGVTIALRREVLVAIGGFGPIANQLADDYRLGELTRQRGLRTVLSDVVVETCVHERSLVDLMRHELRWLRTIRALRPTGYALAGVTFSVPVAALGVLLASGAGQMASGVPWNIPWNIPWIALIVTGVARVLIHFNGRPNTSVRSQIEQICALPLADALGFALWCWGFASRRVHWRQDRFWIARDGSVVQVPPKSPREFQVEDENPLSPPPVI